MKKLWIGILAFVIVLSIETTSVLAAGSEVRRNYIDADNNGVCDYFRTVCEHINTVRDNVCRHFRNDGSYIGANGGGFCGNSHACDGRR